MVSAEMLRKVTARADKIAKEKEARHEKKRQKIIQKREKKLALSIITEAEKRLKEYLHEGHRTGPINSYWIHTFGEYEYHEEKGRPAFLIIKKHFEEKGFAVSLKTEIWSRSYNTYHHHIYLTW